MTPMNFSEDLLAQMFSRLSEGAGGVLRDRVVALLECLKSVEEPVPERVAKLSKVVTPHIKHRISVFLSAYAHACSAESFSPRAIFFDLDVDTETPLRTATRAVGQFRPLYDALVYDLDEFFTALDTPSAAAAWMAYLPAPLVGDDLYGSVAFCYVRTFEGHEGACLLYYDKVLWLGAEGELLADAVSGAMVFSSLGAYALMHKRHQNELKDLTRRRLMDPGVAGVRGALPSDEAESVTERIWGDDSPLNLALHQYLEEVTQNYLDETTSAMFALDMGARLMDKHVQANEAAIRKEAAKTQKRMLKDKERLEMAYQGLKARAERQEQELRQLRSKAQAAANRSPSPQPIEARTDFLTGLRLAFSPT